MTVARCRQRHRPTIIAEKLRRRLSEATETTNAFESGKYLNLYKLGRQNKKKQGSSENQSKTQDVSQNVNSFTTMEALR